MLLILLGALLELAGIVVLAVQVIRYERMAVPASPETTDSLEPVPRGIFTLKKTWPGLALLAAGVLLLLAGDGI